MTVTLDLNNFVIDRDLLDKEPRPAGYVLKNEGTLTITDSSSEKLGAITGGNTEDDEFSPGSFAGGVYNKGMLTLEEGGISFNHATDCAGVYNEGTFYMTGGEISFNQSGKEGAGVGNYGTFHFSGGTIFGNEAVTRGAGVWSGYDFTMTGGMIDSNIAKDNGGGVCVRLCNFREGRGDHEEAGIGGNSRRGCSLVRHPGSRSGVR